MKLRAFVPCVIGLIGFSLASTSEARGIRVDSPPTLGTCTSVPIDATAANFDPNVGISITSECNSTSGVDQAAGDPFETDNNAYSNLNLYNWGTSPSIQAQVADYTLASTAQSTNGVALGDLTEIEFDYPGAPTTCGSGPAHLMWGGTTYSGTCDGTSDFSLLFNGTNLVGVLGGDNVDTECDSTTTCLNDTGWSVGTVTTVPEPDTLALFALATLPVLLLLRRRSITSH